MKKIRNFAMVLCFVTFLGAFPTSANVKAVESPSIESVITISEDGCTMTAEGETPNGTKYKISGSCGAVLRALKKLEVR